MVREAHELLDGSRPIPIDKITYELSQNIILAFDNNEHIKRNKDVQIEIEARIGLVIDKNKHRLKLPIYTDAIVENNFSDFQSGVDKDSFQYLLNYLHNMTRRNNTQSCTTNNNNTNLNDNNKEGNIPNLNNPNKNVNRNDTSAIANSTNNVIDEHEQKKKNNNNNNSDNNNNSNSNNNGDNNNNSNNFLNEKENSIYEFVALKSYKSVDKYYILKNENNSRIRVTTNMDESENEKNQSMIKSLHKENINTWNVYLGNNKDYFEDDDEEEDNEDDETTKNKHNKNMNKQNNSKNKDNNTDDCLDYRISINLEHTKPISKLFLSKITPVYERYKERTSFINKYMGIQFDLTKIKTKDNNEFYEIEIEIPTKSIFKAMSNLRNKNDSNYLHFICSNLINNARGICSQLNLFKKNNFMKIGLNNNDILPSIPASQVNYSHSQNEQKLFKKYIHSVSPIIGDYMFRLVSKNEKIIQKKINDSNISNHDKINMFKNIIDIRRHNKKCTKSVTQTYAENRWKVVKNEKAQNVIVLVSDSSDQSDGEEHQNSQYENIKQNRTSDQNSPHNNSSDNNAHFNDQHNEDNDYENNNLHFYNDEKNDTEPINNKKNKDTSFYDDT
ncbi:mRNA capping enzyme subunit beta [Plasmodium yoelii]|uniref:mRNA 5'-phosphatase n=3 Tax=Plasmodium yoelii TaxID=5861 RepID=Q7PDQ2_PLAYO|nr:mRNA capping enzyme subunit beta [Plasmodium yoelii]EAA15421.1 mRNA capping enzyme, beta chain, putative [Plasmodium yoelii yoelii]WBY59201.1 mRNA-capping enzyme subunit beta [Plasmodium yoelii yoelii]CDU19362.1 RNA triphosphatase, putative [Plasmodium yoelii]VTZ79997.1 mRNA-capping enzyme subunit beta, putative [Plasmodium yoelii]|eukprot:XP_723856.1 mRNA capping enzyme subunit beta [Plasmodium yoelii]